LSAVLLVLSIASLGTDAQSCSPFQGSPLTNHKCDVINEGTNILLRANQTYASVRPRRGSGKCQVLSAKRTFSNIMLITFGTTPSSGWLQVDAAAGKSTRLFGAFVSPACRVAAIRMVCLSNFITCSTSTGSLTRTCYLALGFSSFDINTPVI
jgi:hypothetical protein